MEAGLSQASLEAALETRALGRPVHVLEVAKSTNLELRTRAEAGAPHGTAVVAGAQTAGRGRRGHRWHSPAGAGLYVSFLVRGPVRAEAAPLMTLAAALAAHRVLEGRAGVELGIRWPNDLLARGDLRKLGGVLVESSLDEAGLRYAIVGLGLNLTATPRPEPLRAYATSVEEAGGRVLPRAEVFAALALALEAELDASFTSEAGPAALLARFEAAALGVGATVSVVDDAQRAASGRLLGFAPDGGLRLESEGGPKTLYVGTLRLPGAPVQPEW